MWTVIAALFALGLACSTASAETVVAPTAVVAPSQLCKTEVVGGVQGFRAVPQADGSWIVTPVRVGGVPVTTPTPNVRQGGTTVFAPNECK